MILKRLTSSPKSNKVIMSKSLGKTVLISNTKTLWKVEPCQVSLHSLQEIWFRVPTLRSWVQMSSAMVVFLYCKPSLHSVQSKRNLLNLELQNTATRDHSAISSVLKDWSILALTMLQLLIKVLFIPRLLIKWKFLGTQKSPHTSLTRLNWISARNSHSCSKLEETRLNWLSDSKN